MPTMDKDQIFTRVLQRLKDETEIVEDDPGSLARAICDIFSEEFAMFYDQLDLTTTMGLVGSSTGPLLDLVAELVNCVRLTGESDDNYKARIVNQVYSIAGGNLT